MRVPKYRRVVLSLALLASVAAGSACGVGAQQPADSGQSGNVAPRARAARSRPPGKAAAQLERKGGARVAEHGGRGGGRVREQAAVPRGGEIADPAEQAEPETVPAAGRPDRRHIAVMVENHPDARPQTGLDRADVVYEAPAEYGVPRFLALYGSREAPLLGPVRSARTYYVAWASEYDPVYVHAGGSPKAMSWIEQLGVASIDALRFEGRGFERAEDRIAPHNLYADTRELREEMGRDPALQGDGSWGGLVFGEQPTVGDKAGEKVRVEYETGYRVEYEYDAGTGLYYRRMMGEPHLDRDSKEQLSASVVIVQMVHMWEIKGDGYGRLDADLQDKREALIFQGGRVIEGYWEKATRDSPTAYTTKDGRPVTFKRGQVWIQIAPAKRTEVGR